MNKEQALQKIQDLRAEVDQKFPNNFRLNYYGKCTKDHLDSPFTRESGQMENRISSTLAEIFESDDGFLCNDKDVIISVLNSGFSLIMNPDYIGKSLIPEDELGHIDVSSIPIDLFETLLKCGFGPVKDYEGKIPNNFTFNSLSIADIKRLITVYPYKDLYSKLPKSAQQTPEVCMDLIIKNPSMLEIIPFNRDENFILTAVRIDPSAINSTPRIASEQGDRDLFIRILSENGDVLNHLEPVRYPMNHYPISIDGEILDIASRSDIRALKFITQNHYLGMENFSEDFIRSLITRSILSLKMKDLSPEELDSEKAKFDDVKSTLPQYHSFIDREMEKSSEQLIQEMMDNHIEQARQVNTTQYIQAQLELACDKNTQLQSEVTDLSIQNAQLRRENTSLKQRFDLAKRFAQRVVELVTSLSPEDKSNGLFYKLHELVKEFFPNKEFLHDSSKTHSPDSDQWQQ